MQSFLKIYAFFGLKMVVSAANKRLICPSLPLGQGWDKTRTSWDRFRKALACNSYVFARILSFPKLGQFGTRLEVFGTVNGRSSERLAQISEMRCRDRFIADRGLACERVLFEDCTEVDLPKQCFQIRSEAVEDRDEVFVLFGDEDLFDEAFDGFGVFVE